MYYVFIVTLFMQYSDSYFEITFIFASCISLSCLTE